MTGADLFVKRSVLDEVGAFDPDFLCTMRKQKCNIDGGEKDISN